jgi:hypothetical protein
MIDVIVSNDCPHCHTQVEAMQKSFFTDEYRIINIDSTEFNGYSAKNLIEAVPFVVVSGQDGTVKYAAAGVHDGTELRKIERAETPSPFNLRKARVALTT